MPREVVRSRIELNSEDVEWFSEHYPKGSLSATLSMLLSKFREANTFTPADYAQMAASALNEELKSK
jgi:hypothetical protein